MKDANGKWIGLGVGDVDPEVTRIKQHLRRKFTYAAALDDTPIYDQTLADIVAEMYQRYGLTATDPEGVWTYAGKVRSGYLKTETPPAKTTFYSVTGTWGTWWTGYGFDVGQRIDPERFRHQPVGYNANAFLHPDPQHTYLEARDEGRAELLRMALADPARKVISGYSMGADVVSWFLNAWPPDRINEIRAVIQFGDPSRPAGPTLLGNDPGGEGISDNRPPSWALDRYYSFSLPGDMYPNAVGLLPQLYQILVRAEATVEFATYLFRMITSAAGRLLLTNGPAAGAGALAGIRSMATSDGVPDLVAMVTNIPAIVQTIVTALRFVFTGAHGHYHDQPDFGGLTAVDRAVQIVNAL